MTSDLTTKAAEIRAGLVSDWRKAMEGVPEGPWTHEPWHISEGPPMVHVKEGWLLCAVPADDHARWIARCSPAGISDLLNLIEQQAAELAGARQAISAVTAATSAYLPPNGISKDECINRVLAATDNPKINAVMLGGPNGSP